VRRPLSPARGIPYRSFSFDPKAPPLPESSSWPGALSALDRGELDAVVGDGFSMRYQADKEYGGRIIVLPGSVEPTLVSLGLRIGSPLRKKVDGAILKLAEQGVFKQLARQYGATDD
jgi:ABC-type amino acid transport substrate-binding protein